MRTNLLDIIVSPLQEGSAQLAYIVKTLFKSCKSVIMTVVSHMLKGTSKLKLYHYSFTLMSLQTFTSAFSQSPKFTLLYFTLLYFTFTTTTTATA